jgi:NSS family neurotransmitter:Na+ symporter
VLPALFNNMGSIGLLIALAFFLLMIIASLTSSISMLEVPVAFAVENHGMQRQRVTLVLGAGITVICMIIVLNFARLFDGVVTLTTEYSQPLLGLFFCVFVAWIWNRNALLQEVKLGCPDVEASLFWKIWPPYVKYICPLAIVAVYYQLLTA